MQETSEKVVQVREGSGAWANLQLELRNVVGKTTK